MSGYKRMCRVLQVLVLTAAMIGCGGGGGGKGDDQVPSPVDTTPPTVVSREPADGAQQVASGMPVVITFSETILVAQGNIELLSDKGAIPFSISLNGAQLTLTITDVSNAIGLSTIRLSGIKDLAGNEMAPTEWSWQFREGPTQDTAPPEILSRTPEDGAVLVSPQAPVVVSFNETIDVSDSTITMSVNGEPVLLEYSASGNRLTVNLLQPSNLEGNATLSLSRIKDLAGNVMPDEEWSWNFGQAENSETIGMVFVGQVPTANGISDIGTLTATFGNSLPTIAGAPRGGTLLIRYRDGNTVDVLDSALRNGCGDEDNKTLCDLDGAIRVEASGLLTSGYAVKRPRVNWAADKILFSMVSGTINAQFGTVIPDAGSSIWQLYELENFHPGQSPVIKKVVGQPEQFNNTDGIYGSGDFIFFVSDKTVTDNPNHYPQLDEYESLPINTGLWRLNRTTNELVLMDHSPSGDFGPELTPSGHIVFTRWDHLQRDQQAENSKMPVLGSSAEDFWKAYTYTDENETGDSRYKLVSEHMREYLQQWVNSGKSDSSLLYSAADGGESFPEPVEGNPVFQWPDRPKSHTNRFTDQTGTVHSFTPFTPENGFGRYNRLRFNHFLPWQIRQDGTACETYRHVGLHETGGFIDVSYLDDNALRQVQETKVRVPDGYFLSQVLDVNGLETVIGVKAPEFGTHKAGAIMIFRDSLAGGGAQLHENGDAVEFEYLTADLGSHSWLFRDPIYLSDGRLLAAVSKLPNGVRDATAFDFKLMYLKKGAGGMYEPESAVINEGVVRDFEYWDENSGSGARQVNGRIWEIEPQEIKSRQIPPMVGSPSLDHPESAVLVANGVLESSLRNYLQQNNLALIVSRNVTVRDEADSTQPFNLFVQDKDGNSGEGFARSRSNAFSAGDAEYPVTYLQLFRGDYLRGYEKFATGLGTANFKDNGRRVVPNVFPLHPDNNGEIGDLNKGSVQIAPDGSFAALVPARRALTWQLTTHSGTPVVRERYWLTFQPGEIRVCASCHGVNDRAQTGGGKPENSPQALEMLIEALKQKGAF